MLRQMNRMALLIIFLILLAESFGNEYVFHFDAAAKRFSGQQFFQEIMDKSKNSYCWYNSIQDLAILCDIQSEEPRLYLATSFTYCSTFINSEIICGQTVSVNEWFVNYQSTQHNTNIFQ